MNFILLNSRFFDAQVMIGQTVLINIGMLSDSFNYSQLSFLVQNQLVFRIDLGSDFHNHM
jgi:hypothetical protein